MIRLRKVKSDIELDIITGAIVSTKFLEKIERKVNKRHFRNAFCGEIIEWVLEYFYDYEKAPENEIENIFKAKRKKLGEEKRDLIELYLSNLSKRYEKEKVFNEEYLYDRAVKHFRQRDLENLIARIQNELDRDNVTRASEELVKFQTIHKETSDIFNPFDEEVIDKTFTTRI
ncbi:MAG: hypothetical protein ACW980_24875, partial [Promethearchaeota archaeon]